MSIIVGTINNPLFIPAQGANQQNGESELPLLDGQSDFALLFQNAENGLADDIAGESETTVMDEPADSSERKDEKQPNLDLFGLAAANSLMCGQTENPFPAEKAEGTAILSVGAADSQAGGKPMVSLNPAFRRERVPVSDVSPQAEPEHLHSMRTGLALEAEANRVVAVTEKSAEKPVETGSVAPKSSFRTVSTKVGSDADIHEQSKVQTAPKVFVMQNNGKVNQHSPTNPEAKAEPSAEVSDNTAVSKNAAADNPAQTSRKNAFSFEKAGVEAKANAKDGQDSAFLSNLKAIRTELDARTFRQTANAKLTGKETQSGTAASENTTAKQTKPQDGNAYGLEPEYESGQRNTAGGKKLNQLNPALMSERAYGSKVFPQAEPKQAQSLQTGFPADFGIAPEEAAELFINRTVSGRAANISAQADPVMSNIFGKVGAKADSAANILEQSNVQTILKAFGMQNSGIVNRQVGSHSLESNAAADNPAQTSRKNAFSFEKVGMVETAADAQNGQGSAYLSIRTELDTRTGFRQNSAVQTTAERVDANLSMQNGKVQNGITAFENNAENQTKPQNVQFADAFEPENRFGQSAGVQKDAAKNEPEFEIPVKDKAGPATERFPDVNAAALQSNVQVHSTAAAKAKEAQTQTDIAAQLEAPIKKEASKGVNTSFKIKLKPEGLGEVTVDLRHVSGKLEVLIKTELSSTKELISESIHTLRNALTADEGPNALTLGSLTVEQDGRQFSAFSQSGFSRERHSSGFSGNTFGFQETDKPKTYSTARYKTGLIDYTV